MFRNQKKRDFDTKKWRFILNQRFWILKFFELLLLTIWCLVRWFWISQSRWRTFKRLFWNKIFFFQTLIVFKWQGLKEVSLFCGTPWYNIVSSLSYKKDSRMSEDYFTMKLFLHLKIGTLDQAKTFVPRQDLQILNRIFNAEWESMLWGRVLGETVRQEEEKKNERYWCWRWSLRKEKVHLQ